jgi:hypothetical protein
VSNTYQKTSRRAQLEPLPGEIAVPEQVIVSMTEIASFYTELAGWEIIRQESDWMAVLHWPVDTHDRAC